MNGEKKIRERSKSREKTEYENIRLELTQVR